MRARRRRAFVLVCVRLPHQRSSRNKFKGDKLVEKSNRVTRTAALAIGIGLIAMQANAQQGMFNLPVQAHWGRIVLQPGEHKVQIPIALGQTVVYLHSGNATQMTVPLVTETTASSGRSYLRLTRVNGEYYVDEYQSGLSGQKFIFPKPKANGSVGTGAEESEATLVSVTGE